MEDLDSEELRQWIDAQNELTFGYLEKSPLRKQIQERMTALWDYERISPPSKKASRYFYFFNNGLQNQDVLYWMEALDAEPKVLIDPNTLSEDGTVALSGASISKDGKYLAYGIADAGSDWQTWHVRRVDDGTDTDDLVEWVKFSGASWDGESQGFFYSGYDAPEGEALKQANYFHKLYYHKLGTDQSEDRLVYERPDKKEWIFNGDVTEDGRYLIIYAFHGTASENAVFYLDLTDPDAEVVELLPDFDAEYIFIGNDDTVFYFRTNHNAPRQRLVAIDLAHPAPADWRELIPENADKLELVHYVGGRFICTYLHDAAHQVRFFKTDGTPDGELALPGVGMVVGFSGKSDDSETFYKFSSFNTPGTVYRLDVETRDVTVFRAPRLAFDPDDYVTEQVFYESKDGTRIPLFISHRADLEINGDTPTYLYGYGGFDISIPPAFSVPNLVWMEMGGIYAQAQLRGGGEYGQAWHEAGMKQNKQNVFDDFIAAAEYLIDQGLHAQGEAGGRRPEQRRLADRRGADPAARPFRRGAA